MSTLRSSFLADRAQLFLKQRKEWTEILVGFETRNQYAVLGAGDEELGTLAEKGSGFGRVLARLLLRSHRPLEAAVADRAGALVLRLQRPFYLLFSDLELTDAEGARVGSVHRRFGILNRKYDLRDALGRTFARVRSPLWRIWTSAARRRSANAGADSCARCWPTPTASASTSRGPAGRRRNAR